MHVIAAKAVAFGEALQPDFRDYAAQVVTNARALGAALMARGCDLVTGGTDTHLVLLDLRANGITGRAAEASLEAARLTCTRTAFLSIPSRRPRPAACAWNAGRHHTRLQGR